MYSGIYESHSMNTAFIIHAVIFHNCSCPFLFFYLNTEIACSNPYIIWGSFHVCCLLCVIKLILFPFDFGICVELKLQFWNLPFNLKTLHYFETFLLSRDINSPRRCDVNNGVDSVTPCKSMTYSWIILSILLSEPLLCRDSTFCDPIYRSLFLMGHYRFSSTIYR
jgi:hypothetical protein